VLFELFGIPNDMVQELEWAKVATVCHKVELEVSRERYWIPFQSSNLVRLHKTRMESGHLGRMWKLHGIAMLLPSLLSWRCLALVQNRHRALSRTGLLLVKNHPRRETKRSRDIPQVQLTKGLRRQRSLQPLVSMSVQSRWDWRFALYVLWSLKKEMI